MTNLSSFAHKHWLLLLAIATTCTVAVTIIILPQFKWRAQVVLLQATGQIQDIEWSDLFTFIIPGEDSQSLERLVETRNPYGSLHNTRASEIDLQEGTKVFLNKCADCHGPDARGGPAAPSLVNREFKHGESDWAIFRNIRYGISGTAMSARSLSTTEIWRIIAYIRSLGGQTSNKESIASKQNLTEKVDVSYADILAASNPSADWLTYSGSYSGVRHSALTQINSRNVNQLSARWIHQYQGPADKVESSPIVSNGIMYTSVMSGHVMALDASTGDIIWDFERKNNEIAKEFSGIPNRGVAILGNKVFVGTSDAKLFALSATTGAVIWETTVEKDTDTYGISSAPLVYRDLVVTGVYTRATGGRGFIVAYDANSGKERWRFFTIPGPKEVGNETWAKESWRTGGAPTWLTGSYDPSTDMLYWGAGNPKPDYNTSIRAGDNLYSNSVVALRGATGELAWHFQFTPADNHDWDSNQIPMLVDKKLQNGLEKQLLFANRNGFYYILNRESGKFIKATAFVRQNWTDGIDANGRPTPRSHSASDSKGVLLYPGNGGGTNWWSPSFDAKLNLVFVAILEKGMLFFPSEISGSVDKTTTKNFPRESGSNFFTAIRALNASTGELVWEYPFKPRDDHAELSGVLSSDSGLLFGSDLGTFFALDSATGKLLWSIQSGGRIVTSPVTYMSNGEQFVVISSGRNLMAFALPKSLN